MKTLGKSIRSLLALLLAVILVVSVGGNAAFAASDDTVVFATDYQEVPAMTKGVRTTAAKTIASGTLAPMSSAYSYVAIPALIDTNYWTQDGEPYYDPSYASTVASFQLSDAAKICRLLSYVYPAQNLQYGIDFYTKFNDVRKLDTLVYSGQARSIWSMLSASTRKTITSRGMNAERALKYVRHTAEYRKDAELKRYTDIYLEQTLSGDSLRPQLQIYYPQFATAIDNWSIANLLSFARCIAATPQYKAFVKAAHPVSGMSQSVEAYKTFLSDEELAKCWENLSAAASYYWPDLISMIEACKITLPVNTFDLSN